MYNEELEYIINAIKEANKLYINNEKNTNLKYDFDLVTECDLNIEKYITKKILDKYPNDLICGEEYNSKQEIKNRTWTIDPIDGTVNFSNNIPIYATQVALINNNEIVLSVIYFPLINELLYAIKNEGAYLNDKKITVNNRSLNKAIISLGDYSHKNKEMALKQHNMVFRLYPNVSKLRMFGAASFDFFNVASGKTDATIVMTDNLWDLLPGILLVKEAGGIVTNLDGENYKFGDFGVIASSTKELFDLITK